MKSWFDLQIFDPGLGVVPGPRYYVVVSDTHHTEGLLERTMYVPIGSLLLLTFKSVFFLKVTYWIIKRH